MWDKINNFLTTVSEFVWGWPLMLLIIVGGLLLTVMTRGVQFRKLLIALKYMVKNEKNGEGEVTSFGALCTALSATIGTGNIVGVATAICLGGPGALFWMILMACFGMATKYAEGLLAIKYRTIDSNNHVLGGPFYYIERGMGQKWKWLAKLFAFFGVCAGLLGIGTITQVNGIISSIKGLFDENDAWSVTVPGVGTYSWVVIISSVIITLLVILVIIGGIKRISQVAEVVVPFMAITYVLFCLVLLAFNITKIPQAVVTIFTAAFNPSAVTSGIVGSIFVAMQKGIARGIFSNESGLGSAPIASAAAQTKEPVRQGLVSMTGTFIDTICICTMTGLTIVITGAWQIKGLEGVQVTTYAFTNGLPFAGKIPAIILTICLIFFAFTTILGWNYYSERCLEYLTNKNKIATKIFKFLYITAVFVGPFITVSAVWTIADIFNGLMAIPNMIALFALSGVVAKETKSFFERQKQLPMPKKKK